MKKICISGGFDPLHCGHIDYIADAFTYGSVYVILNSDKWLIRKKGYCFMPWKQRAKILNSLRYVSEVVEVDDSDDSVCKALNAIRPNFFGNGGDRTQNNTLELDICNKLGITAVFGVGGDKSYSSSDIVQKASRNFVL